MRAVPSIELTRPTRCRPQGWPGFGLFNRAGIIRPARLCATPKNHIADISIVTDMDGMVDYSMESRRGLPLPAAGKLWRGYIGEGGEGEAPRQRQDPAGDLMGSAYDMDGLNCKTLFRQAQ